jgi:hypothetical protein
MSEIGCARPSQSRGVSPETCLETSLSAVPHSEATASRNEILDAGAGIFVSLQMWLELSMYFAYNPSIAGITTNHSHSIINISQYNSESISQTWPDLRK